jgi:hypothetical protein
MTQKYSAATTSWAKYGVVIIVVTVQVPLFHQNTQQKMELNPCLILLWRAVALNTKLAKILSGESLLWR